MFQIREVIIVAVIFMIGSYVWLGGALESNETGGNYMSIITVRNVSQNPESVSFTFINEGNTAGEVVFWVEVNGTEYCETMVQVESLQMNTVTLECARVFANISPGTAYFVKQDWAEENRRRTEAAAERLVPSE